MIAPPCPAPAAAVARFKEKVQESIFRLPGFVPLLYAIAPPTADLAVSLLKLVFVQLRSPPPLKDIAPPLSVDCVELPLRSQLSRLKTFDGPPARTAPPPKPPAFPPVILTFSIVIVWPESG